MKCMHCISKERRSSCFSTSCRFSFIKFLCYMYLTFVCLSIRPPFSVFTQHLQTTAVWSNIFCIIFFRNFLFYYFFLILFILLFIVMGCVPNPNRVKVLFFSYFFGRILYLLLEFCLFFLRTFRFSPV